MKFKDLNAIIAFPGEYQLDPLALTQPELEKEVLRLFKEEQKFTKDKIALYHKVYQAIEALDKVKQGFVAEGSKEFRQLYFKCLRLHEIPAQDRPTILKKELEQDNKFTINSYYLLKDNIKKYHFSQPRFLKIDSINDFLKNILNNEIVTVIEGKYLQIQSKEQYKISWLTDEINKQIKLIFKEKPINSNKALSAIETLLYFEKIVPGFLLRAGSSTKNNLEKCLEVIRSDKQLLTQLTSTYNENAKLINDQLFYKYQQIDSAAYKPVNIRYSLTRTSLEITSDNPALMGLVSFNMILKLHLNNLQLKGCGFVPVLEIPSSTSQSNEEVEVNDNIAAFIQQTLNINFEIKLNMLAQRYQEVTKQLQTINDKYNNISEKLSEEEVRALRREQENIAIEFDSRRSIPISTPCFQTMLQHRSSLAEKLGILLTEEQKTGISPLYVDKALLGRGNTATLHSVPKAVFLIKSYLNSINYCIEYTQKNHDLGEGRKKLLRFENLVSNLSTNLELYDQLEKVFEEHRKKAHAIWPGERNMRGKLVEVIQYCQLLNIDLNLQDIDDSKLINIEKELEKTLQYPGSEQLRESIESEHPGNEEQQAIMSFWPEEWNTQYQNYIETLNKHNFPLK